MRPDRWGLRPLVADDAEAVAPVLGADSREVAAQAAADWREVGLGQWAVLVDDRPVGVGGAVPRDGWWDLRCTLDPAVQGHGLGTFVAEVGVGAARRTRSAWPVVARCPADDPVARRACENAGLVPLDAAAADGAEVVLHADRDLDDDVRRAVLTSS